MIVAKPETYLDKIESPKRIELVTSPVDGGLYICAMDGKTDIGLAGARLSRANAIEALTKLLYGSVHNVKVSVVCEAHDGETKAKDAL